jgi:hypothetical protein
MANNHHFTLAVNKVLPLLLVLALALVWSPGEGEAQSPRAAGASVLGQLTRVPPPASDSRFFRSVADSVEWESAKKAAFSDPGRRLVVDLFERRLFWMKGADTLFVAVVAVGSGDTLSFRDRSWQFDTPRGKRVIRSKEPNPVWVPPLWHYVQHARETGRRVEEMHHGRPVALSDGSRLIIRRNQVGRLAPDGTFHPVERGDHIVFDGTVYVPPFGTVNRQIIGELGRYKLDLGEAYLIHGTPHFESIGEAVTRGCIRLGDEDLEFIYRYVPVGTPVYIY